MRTMDEIIERSGKTVKRLPTREQLKTLRKERFDNSGPGWFNMPAFKGSPEVSLELRALQMRGVLDPKSHYKGGQKIASSKYLQIGEFVDEPLDFYANQVNHKSKRTNKLALVDSLLRDEESRQYYKARYEKLQEKATSCSHKKYVELRNRRRKPWERETGKKKQRSK